METFTPPLDEGMGVLRRILDAAIQVHGQFVYVNVEQTRSSAFEHGTGGVTATLAGDDGVQTRRAGYLVGANGAHSTVRKALGLAFEGAAFEAQYMLGDVEVDWSMPRG